MSLVSRIASVRTSLRNVSVRSAAKRVRTAAIYYSPRNVVARWVMASVEDVLPELVQQNVSDAVDAAVRSDDFERSIDEAVEEAANNYDFSDVDFSSAVENWSTSKDGSRAIESLIEEAHVDAATLVEQLDPEDLHNAIVKAFEDSLEDEGFRAALLKRIVEHM